MTCNGNNHASNCQCNFGNGGLPRARSFVWKSWKPKSAAGYFNGPNATCPECRKDVYFIPFRSGGGAYFDRFGPPWPKHPCTDKPPEYSPFTRSGKTRMRSLPTAWDKSGWIPFFVRNIEAFGCGTIIHGACFNNPTVFHLGVLADISVDLNRPVFLKVSSDTSVALDFFPLTEVASMTVEAFPDCLNVIDLLLRRPL